VCCGGADILRAAWRGAGLPLALTRVSSQRVVLVTGCVDFLRCTLRLISKVCTSYLVNTPAQGFTTSCSMGGLWGLGARCAAWAGTTLLKPCTWGMLTCAIPVRVCVCVPMASELKAEFKALSATRDKIESDIQLCIDLLGPEGRTVALVDGTCARGVVGRGGFTLRSSVGRVFGAELLLVRDEWWMHVFKRTFVHCWDSRWACCAPYCTGMWQGST
jgi:hypothetical protein